MAKPKIFVSFDIEKDRQYKYTLNMWNSNSNFEFTCDDRSPSEIQTESVSVVKNVLSRKINEAAVVVVIIGEDANRLHKDWREIGYRNWQNYEIAKANGLLQFKLVRSMNIQKNFVVLMLREFIALHRMRL